MSFWNERKLNEVENKILRSDENIRNNINEAIRDLNPTKEILTLCDSVRKIATLRLNLRFFMNSKFFGKKISRVIAKRNYFAINQIENCLVSEIYLLLNNKKINLIEINKRNNKFVAVKKGKTWTFYTGEKAKKIIKNIKPVIDYKTVSISGSVANSGNVVGKVKIIKNTNSRDDLGFRISEMKKGEILVTEMTRPQVISACKKASAIITDEGGINCHASIISRELNIPCIIGTKIATDVLKDGDLIEVDADNGVVKIIKYNK
ncbi:hypothetical protein GQ568_03430 [Patescibacteria group bacterium]|nr:hypothetical protein [Patescibacteria group bacterium]